MDTNGPKKILPQSVFRNIRPAYHFILALLACLRFWYPSRRLTVIGVTGTNGKSTVVDLLHAILAESGAPTASISSLRFRINTMEARNMLKMTMPGRFTLQRFLHDAARARCRYAVVEVTSEGIKQSRHRFIRFAGAVLTNVTLEHIEAHGGFEPYVREKIKLFARAKGFLIVNGDDKNAKRFLGVSEKMKYAYTPACITVEKAGAFERIPIHELLVSPEGISFRVGDTTITSKLIGQFNVYNILAAVSVAHALGIHPDVIKKALLRLPGIPGRMEFVQRVPFAVVVDYAHTPDALLNVYKALEHYPRRVCVFGAAGGGRDRWKRPEMGRIAAGFCDEIILTNEDPYDENPEAILGEIEKGFSSNEKFQRPHGEKIPDRREAIRAALQRAKPGDVVIITGKGAEPWMMGPEGTKIPWDDRATAREQLEKSVTKDVHLGR